MLVLVRVLFLCSPLPLMSLPAARSVSVNSRVIWRSVLQPDSLYPDFSALTPGEECGASAAVCVAHTVALLPYYLGNHYDVSPAARLHLLSFLPSLTPECNHNPAL